MKIRNLFIIISLLILISCASQPKQKSGSAPAWVSNVDAVYNNRDYLRGVGQAKTIALAEEAAMQRLAQQIRIDINVIRSTNTETIELRERVNRKSNLQVISSASILNDFLGVTSIENLVGVQTSSWLNPSTREAYAVAYMNRRESVTIYDAMLKESERIVEMYVAEAKRHGNSFETVQLYNLAYNTAKVVDNIMSILRVLDTRYISYNLSYGSSHDIYLLLQEANRNIVITLNVTGDNTGRITKAISEFLNKKGFRTSSTGSNNYSITASVNIQPESASSQHFKFVRYTFIYSLKNPAGFEVFSGSENDKSGGLTTEQASERAIQSIELAIAQGEDGFSVKFNDFLNNI